MLLTKARGILASIVLLTGSPLTLRGEARGEFQPVSPEELAMKSEPLAPGAPAIILFRQVDRDDTGLTHEYNYLRIKILTEEGRKYADIELPFVKGFTDIVSIRARTIGPNGSITNFDGKVYEKEIVKAKGLKYLAKTFTLPDVKVGGVIEYMYTVDFRDMYIYDSHWILSQDLFTKKAQFSLKPYRGGSMPMGLRWSWQGLGGVEPRIGPDKVVRMEASNIASFQAEDYMPPEQEMKARVDFIYDNEGADLNPDKYWKDVAKSRNGYLEDFIGKRKAMDQAVAQIVSPSDPPETKLRKIYARVQQLRNTSYEAERSQQEEKRAKEKPPQNVEELWKRGYGNATQLTWLFLALVRAAGLEAYGCWVSPRHEYFFTPKVLDASKLNSNVVLVKVSGKDLFFDPGAQFTPFGLLAWTETGVSGLRMDKDGGSWIVTNLPLSSESQIQRTATLKLIETGDLDGHLKVTYTGLEAMYQRMEQNKQDEVERKKAMEDEVRAAVPAAIEVELTNKPDWTSSDAALVAEFNLKVPGWVAGAGKRALVPVGLFSAGEKHTFEHTNRTHPIYMHFPHEQLDDITISLPLGWLVTSLPKPQLQNGHVVAYTSQVEDRKDSLHITRKLTVDFLVLQQKYYVALRNFYQVVRSSDEEQVLLQPVVASN
jgi:transglutaminase-like putative cysteine protease